MKIRKPKSKAKLFDPDLISTKINQELERDFESFKQMYKGNDHIMHDAFRRQTDELLKKFSRSDVDSRKLEKLTFEKFLAVNDHMLNYNIKNTLLDIDDKPCLKSVPLHDQIHKRAKRLAKFVLGNLDEDELFLECRNSSGSSVGVPFTDTSIQRKFTFPMSVTENVKPLFQRYLRFDFLLNRAIQSMNSSSVTTEMYNVVNGSRATTVDKTSTSRRMICIEPTCNMFLQQGLMRVMYKRLDAVGLDVATLPEQHKKLARESSITCRNATIDWSSASDCVSIELLRRILPPRWFSLIDQLRCKSTTVDSVETSLHMVSSMGNAGTFPLETLVFWIYAIATHQTLKSDSPSSLPDFRLFGKASVFGDDCIVDTTISSLYIEVMTSVGFIVNKEKSFYGSQQFRESCGGDYLQGYDNRPFFLKSPVSTKISSLEPWLNIITNSLLKKYFMYFGEVSYFYSKRVLSYLFGLYRRYKINIKLVPSDFPDDAGLKMSHDIHRLKHHYPMSLNRISRSHHGTYTFNYLRYRYPNSYEVDNFVGYATKLKKFVASPKKPFYRASLRRNGSYVVAKGISCHWHVPIVR